MKPGIQTRTQHPHLLQQSLPVKVVTRPPREPEGDDKMLEHLNTTSIQLPRVQGQLTDMQHPEKLAMLRQP